MASSTSYTVTITFSTNANSSVNCDSIIIPFSLCENQVCRGVFDLTLSDCSNATVMDIDIRILPSSHVNETDKSEIPGRVKINQ